MAAAGACGTLMAALLRLGLMVERVPQRLLVAPQDIRTLDPVLAEQFQHGLFTFAGQSIDVATSSPFAQDQPSDTFTRGLCNFGWLRHLRAAPGADVSASARKLVDEFLRQPFVRGAVAHEPNVTARRLLSFLSQSPILLEGADRSFYDRFLTGLQRDHARVRVALWRGTGDVTRLSLAVAAAAYCLCAAVSPQRLKRANQRLASELDRQVLADGCHISRQPGALVSVLLDLMPMQQAYVARQIVPPPQIAAAVTRMQAHMRKLRHPDGSLALFNGMGPSALDHLALALAPDGSAGIALPDADHDGAGPGGYLRLVAGASVLISDTGVPPPLPHAALAHAGTLAFEFSAGEQRLIINCGSCDESRPLLREAGRLTAAHSTLELDGASSSVIAAERAWRGYLGHQIVAGPEKVSVERRGGAGDVFVSANHDGYARRFGLLHTRQLGLSRDGTRLIGEDALSAAPGERALPDLPFMLRFHLHPTLKAVPLREGRAISLELANGDIWIFEAGGVPLALEDSALIASRAGTRATRQIVVSGVAAAGVRVNWSLTKAKTSA